MWNPQQQQQQQLQPYYYSTADGNINQRKLSGKEKLEKYCRIANDCSDQYLKCNPLRMFDNYKTRAQLNGTNIAVEAGRDVQREFRDAFEKSRATYDYLTRLNGSNFFSAYWQYRNMLLDYHKDRLNEYCKRNFKRSLF